MSVEQKRFLVLLGCLALARNASCAEEGPTGRLPNVLLIVSDDQRPDTIHALGNPRIRTPNLDRLVASGTAFTRAVSPNPHCVTSRAEILSGCSGFRNGVLPPTSMRLEPRTLLWPEAMRRAGYRSWYVGKWHTDGRPSARGYDESRGLFGMGGPTDSPGLDSFGRPVTGYVGWAFQSDAGEVDLSRGVGLTQATTTQIADAAIEVVRGGHDRPFFLHVNFTAPHDPLITPADPAHRYDPAAIPLPPDYLAEHPFDHGVAGGRDELLWPRVRTPEIVRAELALYYAVISDLDAQVGRILEAVDATGRAGDTIVVFTSDHGLAIGSHGLRGKQNMYEHTVGVPLVLAGPGIPGGERRRAQVYLRDLYPTICDLVGVDVPEGLDGVSMAHLLRGGKDEGHASIFGYFYDVQRMVRGDRWKLIRYPKAGREQLFDLVADPFERDDLAAAPEHAGRLQALRAELEDFQRRVGDPLPRP